MFFSSKNQRIEIKIFALLRTVCICIQAFYQVLVGLVNIFMKYLLTQSAKCY